MCGIAGILGATGDPAALRPRVETMNACLTHRGPDDHGFAGGPGWAIAMRRLSVQDTSEAGSQPMRLGDLTLVFNGEVYNFRELRSTLEEAGYSFRSGSDTEVVLASLHRWGMDALGRFNGMFALALIDERRRRAWLARDRFGKKPLFVGRLRDGVHFASELKAFLAVARDELSLCPEALTDYFRMQYVPAPRSIMREVGKLPPASWIEVDLDTGRRTDPTSFWELPAHAQTDEPATPEEVLTTVRESVARRLVADVPVGAFLSGGTDSSLVVACMREAASDVRTFSIGFADPRYDESLYAKAVASHLGTRHTHEQLEWGEAVNLVPAFVDAYDEPFADSSALPTMALARLARRDVTVALSGDGGDELFGGYVRYRVSRGFAAARMLPAMVGRRLRHLPDQHPVTRRGRLFGALAAARDEREQYGEVVAVWRSHERSALMPGQAHHDGFCPGYDRAGTGPVERMMRCDAQTYLVDDILQKVDRASMAHSLEARNPLLDPAVVQLAMRSVDLAEAAPGSKTLLRHALRLRLPPELIDRPKQGFGVPVGEWMRTGLRPLVEDLVLGREAPEYDRQTARRLVEDHLAGRREAAHRVWTLLVFELWRQRWLG